MEYLLVIGISLLFIIPTIIVFAIQSSDLEDDLTAAQVERIGQELIGAAEEVYYLGPPSRQVITITMPSGIRNITIEEQDIIFTYSYSSTEFTYFATSRLPLNLNGTLLKSQGRHDIVIQATQNGVIISELS